MTATSWDVAPVLIEWLRITVEPDLAPPLASRRSTVVKRTETRSGSSPFSWNSPVKKPQASPTPMSTDDSISSIVIR